MLCKNNTLKYVSALEIQCCGLTQQHVQTCLCHSFTDHAIQRTEVSTVPESWAQLAADKILPAHARPTYMSSRQT